MSHCEEVDRVEMVACRSLKRVPPQFHMVRHVRSGIEVDFVVNVGLMIRQAWTGYFAGIEKAMMYARISARAMKRHSFTRLGLECPGESLKLWMRASSVCRK